MVKETFANAGRAAESRRNRPLGPAREVDPHIRHGRWRSAFRRSLPPPIQLEIGEPLRHLVSDRTALVLRKG